MNRVKVIGATNIHGIPIGTFVNVISDDNDGIVVKYNRKNKFLASWEVEYVFPKLIDLIGYEVDFTIGKKKYRAIIQAVSLPDDECTVYPNGEINEYHKKEFATIYCAKPYWFNLSIKGRNDFWTKRIENIDLSNPVKVEGTEKYFKFKDIEAAKKIYHG